MGVDDDELFGLGGDFNILEYADPELHDGTEDLGVDVAADVGVGVGGQVSLTTLSTVSCLR